jgi:hypothetical protein
VLKDAVNFRRHYPFQRSGTHNVGLIATQTGAISFHDMYMKWEATTFRDGSSRRHMEWVLFAE